jgi:hypothetical protein
MKQEPVAWRTLCVSNIGEDSEWIYNEIGQGEPLYTAPRELNAKEMYDKACIDGEDKDPIERLRFYCSLAMTGQDWLDAEPFFDAIKSAPRELSDEEILELTKDSTIFEYREFDDDMIRFARAILKKASEK